ncbi:MAG: hypothetical protein CALGDGBN_03055 [Pseudomonadales bacterium]|nr:hypothetical protein [Pseudomonadales bacterium]
MFICQQVPREELATIRAFQSGIMDHTAFPSAVATRHWHALADGRVQCDACPRFCRLRPGQRGLCYVRANQDDALVLTTWGRSSGFCIDPIEKKPLYHFLPGTPVLSFGTAGCNLACRFCQNWDISKSRDQHTAGDEATPEAIAAAARALGARSVAYTYNDPAVFFEYAVDVAAACRAQGIASVAVSAGYMTPAARADFFPAMDAANVDLKAFSDDFYRSVCGARLAPVLDTLCWLRHETSVWLEITTLLIPGRNDADAELEAMARWVVDNLGPGVPWHFSAFHPDWKMRDLPPTPRATLERAHAIARAHGVRHAYVGNVRDPRRSTTYCHACEAPLIARDGYRIGAWQLTADGRCPRCGSACAGRFEAQPGDWGPRRQPLRPGDFQP